jgi:hypothetical protein
LHAFSDTFIDKINTLDHKEGKSFWNSINSLKNNNNKYSSPISMGEWLDYYKSLLNTNLEGNTHSDLEMKLILNSEIHISYPYVIIGVINESKSFIHFSTEMKLE